MTEPAVCGPGLSDSKAEAAASPARPAAAALGGSRRGRGSTCAPAPPARHRLELQVTTRGCPRAGLLFLPREARFREFDRKPRAPCRLLRLHPPRVPVWLLGPRGCCFDVTCLTCGRSRVKPPPPGSHTQQRAPNSLSATALGNVPSSGSRGSPEHAPETHRATLSLPARGRLALSRLFHFTLFISKCPWTYECVTT